jgi:hypothetical protein
MAVPLKNRMSMKLNMIFQGIYGSIKISVSSILRCEKGREIWLTDLFWALIGGIIWKEKRQPWKIWPRFSLRNNNVS